MAERRKKPTPVQLAVVILGVSLRSLRGGWRRQSGFYCRKAHAGQNGVACRSSLVSCCASHLIAFLVALLQLAAVPEQLILIAVNAPDGGTIGGVNKLVGLFAGGPFGVLVLILDA